LKIVLHNVRPNANNVHTVLDAKIKCLGGWCGAGKPKDEKNYAKWCIRLNMIRSQNTDEMVVVVEYHTKNELFIFFGAKTCPIGISFFGVNSITFFSSILNLEEKKNSKALGNRSSTPFVQSSLDLDDVGFSRF